MPTRLYPIHIVRYEYITNPQSIFVNYHDELFDRRWKRVARIPPMGNRCGVGVHVLSPDPKARAVVATPAYEQSFSDYIYVDRELPAVVILDFYCSTMERGDREVRVIVYDPSKKDIEEEVAWCESGPDRPCGVDFRKFITDVLADHGFEADLSEIFAGDADP